MKLNKPVSWLAAGMVLMAVTSGALANDKYLGELGSNWMDHVQLTKTRAQVKAELFQARAQGPLALIDGLETVGQAPAPSRTRAEVVQEHQRYAQSGEKVRDAAALYIGG